MGFLQAKAASTWRRCWLIFFKLGIVPFWDKENRAETQVLPVLQAVYFLKTLVVTRNCRLTWLYGQKIPPQNISHPHVIFSGICRAIPQTLVAQKPLDYAVQEKKKKTPETVGLYFWQATCKSGFLKQQQWRQRWWWRRPSRDAGCCFGAQQLPVCLKHL